MIDCMELRVVLVEPIYQINLGYTARVAKNFGVDKLYLVNPMCKYNGKEAIKYAKHARDLLSNAKICRSMKDATHGTLLLGTTALWRKTGKSFFNVYTLDRALHLLEKRGATKVSIIIGRDNTGLSKEELSMCDATVFIPTNEDYPVLNISHALAILLYSFTQSSLSRKYPFESSLYADNREINSICNLFSKTIGKRNDIRDKNAVLMSFNHILKRSFPTKKELSALSIALSPRYIEIKRRKARK